MYSLVLKTIKNYSPQNNNTLKKMFIVIQVWEVCKSKYFRYSQRWVGAVAGYHVQKIVRF